MSRKKKGTALVLTLAVTSMLIILALSLMALSTSNRITTAKLDSSSQLKTIAQTGVERGIVILKNAIANNVMKASSDGVLQYMAHYNDRSVIIDSDPESTATDYNLRLGSLKTIKGTSYRYRVALNAFDDNANISSDSDPIYGNIYIDFEDDQTSDYHLDPVDKTKKYCIEITVTAYGRQGQVRRVTAYIDKDSISNLYFERLFNNTITVLDDGKDTNTKAFDVSMDNPATSAVSIGGNIYLQGNYFELKSSNGAFNDPAMKVDGNIKVNNLGDDNTRFLFEPNILKFYKYNSTVRYDKNVTDFPQSLTQQPYSFPNSFTNKTFSIGASFDTNGNYVASQAPIVMTNLNPLGIVNANDDEDDVLQNNLFSSNVNGKFFTCKVKQNGTTPVDFFKLVLGSDLDSHIGLRRYVANNFSSNKDPNFLSYYKLILVDGDLNIDAKQFYYDELADIEPTDVLPGDFRELFSTNYIIICSGTVTIKGKLMMNNSSIMAKHIKILDHTYDLTPDQTTNQAINYDANAIGNIKTILEQIKNDRLLDSVKETIHDIDNPDDILKDKVDSTKDFQEPLLTDTKNLMDEYQYQYNKPDASKLPTEVTINGIGTDDSMIFIRNFMQDYDSSDTDIPQETRGYLLNKERAGFNEYLLKNLSTDYAKEITFKIIDWKEY